MISKSKTFLILGSGSTSGSFKVEIEGEKFNPPKDRNFFDSEAVKKLYDQKKLPALYFFQNLRLSKSLEGDLTKYSLEKTWSDIDLASKLTNNNNPWKLRILSMAHEYKDLQSFLLQKAEIKNNKDFKNNLNSQLAWVDEGGSIAPLASWEAVELILRLYSDLRKEKGPPLLNVLKCILANSNLRGIATFNYDCSIESIWPDLNVTKLYYYDPDHSAGYTNGIPLYKLHGSINWPSIFDGRKEPARRWHYSIPTDITDLPISQIFNQGDFLNGIPDYIKEPTVIAPDLFKQNITLDIQYDTKSILFKKIWNRVWEDLNGIDVLIFIGFSFPDTDHHAKLLFSSAYRRKPFKRVIVNTSSNESIGRYKSIFDKGVDNTFNKGIEDMGKRQSKLIALLNQ